MTVESLQRLELKARIVSLVAIPILVALFGWLIQFNVNEQSLRKEYVQLAVSILGSQGKSTEHDSLKGWAVQLLAENAPVKPSENVLAALRAGTALTPMIVRVPVPIPCGPLDLPRPDFPFDSASKKDSDYKLITLLQADRLVRQGYIAELEAVLDACRGTPRVNPK